MKIPKKKKKKKVGEKRVYLREKTHGGIRKRNVQLAKLVPLWLGNSPFLLKKKKHATYD